MNAKRRCRVKPPVSFCWSAAVDSEWRVRSGVEDGIALEGGGSAGGEVAADEELGVAIDEGEVEAYVVVSLSEADGVGGEGALANVAKALKLVCVGIEKEDCSGRDELGAIEAEPAVVGDDAQGGHAENEVICGEGIILHGGGAGWLEIGGAAFYSEVELGFIGVGGCVAEV